MTTRGFPAAALGTRFGAAIITSLITSLITGLGAAAALAGCRGHDACTATSCGPDAVCALGTCERDDHVAVSAVSRRLVSHPRSEQALRRDSVAETVELGSRDAQGAVLAWEIAPELARDTSIEAAHWVLELADGCDAPSEPIHVELRELAASGPLSELRAPVALGRVWASATLEAPVGRVVRLDVTEAVRTATSHARWPLRWVLVARATTGTGASVWTARASRGPYLDVYTR